MLLRNERQALPLDRSAVHSIVVVGSLAAQANIGDLGSSSVAPTSVVTALDGIRGSAGSVAVTFIPGPELSPADQAAIVGRRCGDRRRGAHDRRRGRGADHDRRPPLDGSSARSGRCRRRGRRAELADDRRPRGRQRHHDAVGRRRRRRADGLVSRGARRHGDRGRAVRRRQPVGQAAGDLPGGRGRPSAVRQRELTRSPTATCTAIAGSTGTGPRRSSRSASGSRTRPSATRTSVSTRPASLRRDRCA